MAANRRTLLLAVASTALLAACGGAQGAGTSDADMSLGSADAKVHLVEYASATCPHCAHFHETVWPELKAEYIDTGKVRFTFREFPTPPPAVAVAGFQLARCGNASPEEYFNRLGAVFAQQRQIVGSGSMVGAEAALIRIGQLSNLSPDQVRACLRDEEGARRVQRIVEDATRRNVTGTPTFFINDEMVEDQTIRTPEGMKRILDAALAQNQG